MFQFRLTGWRTLTDSDSPLQLHIGRTFSTLLATKNPILSLGFAIEVNQSLFRLNLIYGHNCRNQRPLTEEPKENFEGRHVRVGATPEKRYSDNIGRCYGREATQNVKKIGQSMGKKVAIFDKMTIYDVPPVAGRALPAGPHLYGCIRRNQGGTSRKQTHGN